MDCLSSMESVDFDGMRDGVIDEWLDGVFDTSFNQTFGGRVW